RCDGLSDVAASQDEKLFLRKDGIEKNALLFEELGPAAVKGLFRHAPRGGGERIVQRRALFAEHCDVHRHLGRPQCSIERLGDKRALTLLQPGESDAVWLTIRKILHEDPAGAAAYHVLPFDFRALELESERARSLLLDAF